MKALLLAIVFILASFPVRAAEESVYERVMRTGTIRCGYQPWSIYLMKEPNTGTLSGIFYDYLEEMGSNLGLTIEWAEEIGDAEIITALETGRVDANCTILFWNAERARLADFVEPIFYMGTEVFARDGDTRFDNTPQAINNPDVKIVAVDGDIFAKIAKVEFPKASVLSLPQLTSEAEIFMSVAGGKADLLLNEPYSAMEFMKSNPRKIRRVPLRAPLRYSPVSVMVKGGEDRFRRMLDVATVEMHGNGAIERILKKYEEHKGAIYRVSPPFEAAQ